MFQDILLIPSSGLIKQAFGWGRKVISNCHIFSTVLRHAITQKKVELKSLLHVIFLLSVYSHILLFFLSNTDPILWNIFTNLSSICQMHHYQKNLSEICGGIYFMMNL